MSHGLTHPMLAERPWEVWAFDLVGPLPETEEGNAYLLTAVDVFSRYPLAIPVANKSIKTIATALHKHLVTVFGPPKLLLSDREKSFVSGVVKSMYRKMGVKKVATTGYQPTGNGAVERFHRWLNCTLTMFVNERKDDWDDQIDSILFAYRTSVCGPTGYSPFELGFGRKPMMPPNLTYDIDPQLLEEEKRRGVVVSESMRGAYRFVRERQAEAARRNKCRRDKKREKTQFKVGDPVMVYDHIHEVEKGAPKGLRKLKYRFSGPHAVHGADPESELHYFVKESGGKVRKLHVNRLRLYCPISDDLAPACGSSQFTRKPTPQRSGVVGDVTQPESGDSHPDNVIPEPAALPQVGDMVIVGCEPSDDESPPWAVAEVLERDTHGAMVVRWYGNDRGRLVGAWRPGFYQPTDSRWYYRTRKDHPSHVPYTSGTTNTAIDDSHIVVFGFKLGLTTDKVPLGILKIISESEHVLWELPSEV
jgi:transposase InsO family protein